MPLLMVEKRNDQRVHFEAMSPLRGHTKDKECYIEVSKDLSRQRGETEH